MSEHNKKINVIKTKKRLVVVYFMTGLLMIACLTYAIVKVVSNGDEYRINTYRQATGNSTTVKAYPGNIIDANGNYLATSKKVYRLIFDPSVLAQTEKLYPGSQEVTIQLVSKAFSLSEDAVREAFTADTTVSYLRFGGNTIISEEEYEAFEDYKTEFAEKKTENNKAAENDSSVSRITAKIAGVWFEEEYRRTYPQSTVLSKVVGYTTTDAAEGITGLELYYDDILRGTDGMEYSYIDSDGNTRTELADAVDGYNLQTSLDVNVAKILQECIAEFSEEIGGHRINILVMDPNNGEVIATASDTDFNLNEPSDLTGIVSDDDLDDPDSSFLLTEAFKGNEETLESMSRDELLEALTQQVQLNYAISGTYEPGSTSKSITMAAGIEDGVITPDTTFYCDGTIQVEKYTIHCHMGSLCGDLNPMEALGRSCNVCYVQIGNAIGRERLEKYQEIFNLGQKTGIDLPGEANTSGLLYYGDDMGSVELATCSFGQSFNVTMIQFAAAYASLVNGGYYYQPHVVTKITDTDGNTVKEIEPVLVRQTISEETSAYMREALQYVVEQGTATYVKMDGYKIGGKTGASEKLPRGTGKYVVSFIGAIPIDDPQFLIYVTVDEPYAEDQSMSAPAQILTEMCLEKLLPYYHIYSENSEDAYSYDWSSLRDSSEESDGSNGEENVEENVEENAGETAADGDSGSDEVSGETAEPGNP